MGQANGGSLSMTCGGDGTTARSRWGRRRERCSGGGSWWRSYRVCSQPATRTTRAPTQTHLHLLDRGQGLELSARASTERRHAQEHSERPVASVHRRSAMCRSSGRLEGPGKGRRVEPQGLAAPVGPQRPCGLLWKTLEVEMILFSPASRVRRREQAAELLQNCSFHDRIAAIGSRHGFIAR